MNQEWLSISDIVTLMEAFQKNNLGAFELHNGEQSVRLKSKEAPAPVAAASAGAAAMPPQALAPQTPGPDEAAPALSGNTVKSPIVGTFYSAPAPDQEPFVKVGQKVKKGDVLFIIESMKLMNEVASEFDGTVTQILLENAQPVEYGQPVLCIE